MEVKLVIKDCSECPFKDHLGGFGKVSYIPCCKKKKDKKLPYKVGEISGLVVANPTYAIPKWCPLPAN
jgi:hypothetical protein